MGTRQQHEPMEQVVPRRSNRLREERMIAQSYRNPDVFDEWLEDFTREITQGFGDNFREKLNMDDDDFMEVLRAMLVEMESYDILYTKVSDMDLSLIHI